MPIGANCTEPPWVVTGISQTQYRVIPAGCSHIVVKTWGSGGFGYPCQSNGAGGGGGGYARLDFEFDIAAGQVFPYQYLAATAGTPDATFNKRGKASYVQWATNQPPTGILKQILILGGGGGTSGCDFDEDVGTAGGGGGGTKGEDATAIARGGFPGTDSQAGVGGDGDNCDGENGFSPSGAVNGGFSTPANGGGYSGYGNCEHGGTGGDGYYGGGEGGQHKSPPLPPTKGGGGGGGGSFVASASLIGSDDSPPPTLPSYYNRDKATGLLGTPFGQQGGALPGNAGDPERCCSLDGCSSTPACLRSYGSIPQDGGGNVEHLGENGVIVVHFLGPRAIFKDPGDTCFSVPSGVSTVTIKAWGAGGARNSGTVSAEGGGGGYAGLTVSGLQANDPLCIHVGSPGQFSTGSPVGGGESSYVVRGPLVSGTCQAPPCELLLVAGGGGGAGARGTSGALAGGGAGGGQSGANGADHPAHTGSAGGGGSESAGGAGGDPNGLAGTYIEATPGTFDPHNGGPGSSGTNQGGGGYYGAGGGGYGAGFMGGAGGGSGYYASSGSNGAKATGNGSSPANIYDVDYRAPAGEGAVAGKNGASAGLVVISW